MKYSCGNPGSARNDNSFPKSLGIKTLSGQRMVNYLLIVSNGDIWKSTGVRGRTVGGGHK